VCAGVYVYVCRERKRRVFSVWYLHWLRRGLNISKEWMKQAMEEDWNIMLAHYMTAVGFVNHEDTGSVACHIFQIIISKEWSIHLSSHMYQLSSHWMNSYEIGHCH
jgi:hypothetical protein